MPRMISCKKLHKELPGLPYKPFPDEFGQKIYDTISLEAWRMWVEHSKMIVNEYRLDLSDPQSHKLMREQCEAFFFQEQETDTRPPDYVPPSQ